MNAFPIIVVLPLVAACSDYTVTEGEPDIDLATYVMDHGEVVVGNQSTIGIGIENKGMGDLLIELAELDGTTSTDFTLLTLETARIGPSEEGEIRVRYVPDGVGQDFGVIAITSNDPDEALVEVDLLAFGVEPTIDVDPETLWYGLVEVEESVTRSVEISAHGTGTLNLQSIGFSGSEGDAYEIIFPDGVEFPYGMATGHSFSFDVVFTPPSADTWEGSILVASNDPTAPEVEISLLGNTEDDPTENAPPVVEIMDPDWGAYHLEGEVLAIKATVYDEEDAAESLAVMFYAENVLIGTDSPDDTGIVSLSTSAVPAGEVQILVRAMDIEGLTGEDTVDIVVWDSTDPLEYTISGGSTLFDYWTVDDDVTIYVDGSAIFVDDDGEQDTHPPVSFEANVGSTIRIVAEDEKWCTRLIDPLFLHFGSGNGQDLNDGICLSACEEHSCYDETFDGTAEWPEDFLDESFTVSIP